MGKIYLANKKLKGRLISDWLQGNEEFLKKRKISVILKVIGFCLLIGITLAFSIGSGGMELGIVAGLGLGAVVGCIPFSIGSGIGTKAFNECGEPFTKREKEYILISNDEIEFGFSNVDNKYKESMDNSITKDIYSITKEKISAINVNGNVLTIIGEGRLISYDDIISKRVNQMNSQRRFYSNTPYSILLDFDDKDKIIQSVKNIVK